MSVVSIAAASALNLADEDDRKRDGGGAAEVMRVRVDRYRSVRIVLRPYGPSSGMSDGKHIKRTVRGVVNALQLAVASAGFAGIGEAQEDVVLFLSGIAEYQCFQFFAFSVSNLNGEILVGAPLVADFAQFLVLPVLG